jgi:hypothetical protein
MNRSKITGLSKSLRRLFFRHFAITLLIPLVTCSQFVVPGHTSMPTDARLEQVFSDNESDFKRLVHMAYVDEHVIRIAPGFTWLENDVNWPRASSEIGFSEERWNEYRRLFEKLNLDNGLARYTDSVYLFASSSGQVTGGIGKGYVYSMAQQHPQYDSLDNLKLSSVNGNRAFKKIRDDWYLVLQWE